MHKITRMFKSFAEYYEFYMANKLRMFFLVPYLWILGSFLVIGYFILILFCKIFCRRNRGVEKSKINIDEIKEKND